VEPLLPRDNYDERLILIDANRSSQSTRYTLWPAICWRCPQERLRAGNLSPWHVDGVFVKVNSKLHYLWPAVDHQGGVSVFFVSKRRDNAGALKFLKKAMKRHGRPEVMVTDGLRAYGAAVREIGNLNCRDVGHWKNNRAENSHQPFRRREAAMLQFGRSKTLQKFVAVQSQVHNHFNSERHLVSREIYKHRRSAALAEWRIVAA
jgi:putative transposase